MFSDILLVSIILIAFMLIVGYMTGFLIRKPQPGDVYLGSISERRSTIVKTERQGFGYVVFYRMESKFAHESRLQVRKIHAFKSLNMRITDDIK